MKLTHFAAVASLAAVALMATSPVSANSRSTVKVVNNSSASILSIQSSPRHRTAYGKTDLLGTTVLRSGYYVYVDFESADAENECWQDVVARGTGGLRWNKTMNVCAESSWTLVD